MQTQGMRKQVHLSAHGIVSFDKMLCCSRLSMQLIVHTVLETLVPWFVQSAVLQDVAAASE